MFSKFKRGIMKHIHMEIFNTITETHFQFQHQFPDRKSLLFPAIKSVLKCSEAEAERIGSTHCNLVSMYAPIRAKGLFNAEYDKFFQACLDSKYVTKQGYITDKPLLLKYLKIESPLTTYREYEDILDPGTRLKQDKFYQVKIKSQSGGDHFMSTYIKSGILYLSDTSFRGIGVKATDFINDKNFQKITEVV